MKPSNPSPLRVHRLSSRMATACLILILAADCLVPAAATANRKEDAHETHRATADSRICELPRPDRSLDLCGFGSSSEPVDWQLAGQTNEISRFIPDTAPADPGDEYWAALGQGNGIDDYVFALAPDDAGNLYAGGRFTSAGGASVNHIAKWDGTAWSRLGSGIGHPYYPEIHALAFDTTGNLYAGGVFSTAGGSSANYIAKWDGGSWSALGSGLNDIAYALALDDAGNLYVGGDFTRAGGTSANRIARWDQTTGSWSALGSGMDDRILALAVDPAGHLYAGGKFPTAGGVSASNIARWDPATSSWSPLGRGTDFPVYALALDDAGNLYAGGGGWYDSSGESLTDHLAKWDGENWSSLGSMNGSVYALAWDSASATLYAGGWFDFAGGVRANKIARWDPTSQTWSPLDVGLYDGGVAALAVDSSKSKVYVAGWFTVAGGSTARQIAQWDATTSSWSALGDGVNDTPNALVLDSATSGLYVGSEFSSAGGIASLHMARWGPSVVAPIEQPSAGAFVSGTVGVRGFAIDRASEAGTGIDMVHIYLDGPDGTGAFIGAATYGQDRPDVAAQYGARFGPSGWELAWDTNGVAHSVHWLYLYAHRTTDNAWSVMDPHLVIVPGGPTRWLPIMLHSR